MSVTDLVARRPVAAGLAAVLGLATAMTMAPIDQAAADRNDRAAAAAATGFAAGAIVGATAAQQPGTVYVAPAPRATYVAPARNGYRNDCRTKTVKVVDRATGRTVVKKTRTC